MRRHSGAPPPGPAFGRPDDRLSGEPGIHNHWPRIMDSGLATWRWRPGMTPFVDDARTISDRLFTRHQFSMMNGCPFALDGRVQCPTNASGGLLECIETDHSRIGDPEHQGQGGSVCRGGAGARRRDALDCRLVLEVA